MPKWTLGSATRSNPWPQGHERAAHTHETIYSPKKRGETTTNHQLMQQFSKQLISQENLVYMEPIQKNNWKQVIKSSVQNILVCYQMNLYIYIVDMLMLIYSWRLCKNKMNIGGNIHIRFMINMVCNVVTILNRVYIFLLCVHMNFIVCWNICHTFPTYERRG